MTEVPNMVPALPEIFVAVIAMALLMLGVFQKADEAPEFKVRVRRAGSLEQVSVDEPAAPAGDAATGN